MYQLPPLPEAIRPLLNDDSERLQREYGSSLPSGPDDCVTCRGKKTFRWYIYTSGHDDALADLTRVVDYQCPCDDQWLLNRYLLNSGIGLNYQRLGWEDLVAPVPKPVWDYLQKARGFIDAGMGLVLHGEMGTGKSLLCTLVLKDLIGRGVGCYFTTFSALIERFTSGFHSPEDKEWFYRKIKNIRVLTIDDIGREHHQRQMVQGEGVKDRVTAMARSTVDEVLRHRLAQSLPTFLTTNHDLGEVSQRYGLNVLSLLSERAVVHQFLGEDFRPSFQSRLLEEVINDLIRPIVL